MDDLLKHRTNKEISPGKFYPLGASLTTDGVNFALYSEHASEVYLILFDQAGAPPSDIIKIQNRSRYVWHCFVRGLKAGQLYGFKVSGPTNPLLGYRFNDYKLLMDPYAKALTGKYKNTENLLLAYNCLAHDKDLSIDNRDNSLVVPKSIVVDDRFDWQGDVRPDTPLEKTIIYEVHLKGFTAHPSSKVERPGTYLGFIEKISYLQELGITAVEFLPLHEFYIDDFLSERGLTNYWGYNSIGFFAPESSYGSGSFPGSQVNEFKTLVRALHKVGIEVILDVVYNHTGEGNELGPTISLKEIDNTTYYCLTGGKVDPYRYYLNYTGCGNSLNLANPHVIRFVMDSLRYWVEVMHVDGFRFDLASVLGRQGGSFQSCASFFDAVSQDPSLGKVKLIAEPWDLGTYQVGNFPVDWSEWNGKFRDTVRKFGKGDEGQAADMGWRLSGSADLYADDGRSAFNSINFVTCHDGFTLNDLVSYNQKHNDANLEQNRDGSDDNGSWNCGQEGETMDLQIISLRQQMAKNYICTLLFASGTPMILGGDEYLRTQSGNNNAYCQDNALSWFNWDRVKNNEAMLNFVKKTIALTKKYTVLQSRKFFIGKDLNADNVPDITWFGKNRLAPEWSDPKLKTVSYRLDGGEEKSELGRYYLFLIFNADHCPVGVDLPPLENPMRWARVIDTSLPAGEDFLDFGSEILLNPADVYIANPRSTVLLVSQS